jgi:hypothetical protein
VEVNDSGDSDRKGDIYIVSWDYNANYSPTLPGDIRHLNLLFNWYNNQDEVWEPAEEIIGPDPTVTPTPYGPTATPTTGPTMTPNPDIETNCANGVSMTYYPIISGPSSFTHNIFVAYRYFQKWDDPKEYLLKTIEGVYNPYFEVFDWNDAETIYLYMTSAENNKPISVDSYVNANQQVYIFVAFIDADDQLRIAIRIPGNPDPIWLQTVPDQAQNSTHKSVYLKTDPNYEYVFHVVYDETVNGETNIWYAKHNVGGREEYDEL